MVQRVPEQFKSPVRYGEQSTAIKHRRERAETQHAVADWTETDENDEETEEEGFNGDELEDEQTGHDPRGCGSDDHEDGDEGTALLPIFSAAHLDAIPIYHLTHSIRMIVLPRSETTLTWDQLRSPQVSQFLMKPMQQQIRSAHFSRATLYALMANCLQFGKEGQKNPANAGNSRTRAMICELLAIKLLKEYSTRELIDALSYDFYPLQGMTRLELHPSQKNSASRISTLEIAIRAQAKRFLAHPAVIQQLEAVWAGTIVFHSTADQLHRSQIITPPNIDRGYGGTYQRKPRLKSSTDPETHYTSQNDPLLMRNPTRRIATLYDPRNASLFKLSRLRVPRYRQFFSTCSLTILLGLFLAVLSQRSANITTLEVIFWFWSAGFMLDEIVGFTEQGFSLYILSFWNAFDLGILLFFVIFYFMRLYGIFLVDVESHEDWNSMAYDVLGANAVLLCPRVFSVLDNSRYFSQLLIAFRLMAVDLAAVLVLIIISCSGFFVAFTLSFGNNEEEAAGVAYRLFQIFNGYSPAAWEVWELYNPLGKAILILFLFVCHFLIITIIITVLTSSFLAVVSNANEEHQFVFAVNTISMVKNEALFSYVAPSNILAWITTPLHYIMPFRQFVKINRYVIKLTHWPLLFSIFAYEKIFLARMVYEPTDLVENRGREHKRTISFMDPDRVGLFSPSIRMKQESVFGYQKDRVLDEVFRLTPRSNQRPLIQTQERRQTSNAVNNWMEQHEGIANSPPEQDRSVVNRLERRRQASHKATLIKRGRLRRQVSGARSDGSGPPDRMSLNVEGYGDFLFPKSQPNLPVIAVNESGTEEDGDAWPLTNEEDRNLTTDKSSRDTRNNVEEEDYFRFPVGTRVSPSLHDTPTKPSSPKHKTLHRPHTRNLSTNTILYNPIEQQKVKSSSSASPQKLRSTKQTPAGTGTHTPNAKNSVHASSKPQPIMANRSRFQSTEAALFNLDSQVSGHQRRRRSSMDIAMDITSDLGIPDPNLVGAVPASFATQMAMATGLMKNTDALNESTDRMMGRLMLARMKTLEEGLQDVVKGFKEMRAQDNSAAETSGDRRWIDDKGKRTAGKKREKQARKTSSVGRETVRRDGDETPENEIIGAFLNKGSS